MLMRRPNELDDPDRRHKPDPFAVNRAAFFRREPGAIAREEAAAAIAQRRREERRAFSAKVAAWCFLLIGAGMLLAVLTGCHAPTAPVAKKSPPPNDTHPWVVVGDTLRGP